MKALPVPTRRGTLPESRPSSPAPAKEVVMASHAELWKVVRRLDSDFEPYGARKREGDNYGPDCSCACRFFHKLHGEHGMDWGVCANADSPRAGLLTFEHMGCRVFAERSEEDDRDEDT